MPATIIVVDGSCLNNLDPTTYSLFSMSLLLCFSDTPRFHWSQQPSWCLTTACLLEGCGGLCGALGDSEQSQHQTVPPHDGQAVAPSLRA